MTLISAVQARLNDLVPALGKRTAGVADMAALVQQDVLPQRMPAAFVLPLGFDAGAADAATGTFRQPVNEMIGVVLFVEALGDPKAEKALTKVDELKDAVVQALAGWVPAGAIDALVMLRGRLLSVTSGTVIYQVDFALQGQVRIAR
jgi:hypothetical protein